MRRYQKDSGLVVDSIMLPGVETLSALQASLGARLKIVDAPSPDEVDDHHDRIAQVQDGLLTVTPLGATPVGVKTGGSEDAPGYRQKGRQVAQVDEATMLLLGLGAAAAAAGGAIDRKAHV